MTAVGFCFFLLFNILLPLSFTYSTKLISFTRLSLQLMKKWFWHHITIWHLPVKHIVTLMYESSLILHRAYFLIKIKIKQKIICECGFYTKTITIYISNFFFFYKIHHRSWRIVIDSFALYRKVHIQFLYCFHHLFSAVLFRVHIIYCLLF